MLSARIGSRLREFELEVELEVEPGRCLALVGPSGAGKTTVLRAIAGLHRPDRGRIALGEDLWLDLADDLDLEPERRRCGYLFQDYALFPHLSAWRNVAFGLSEIARGERRARAQELLAAFGVESLAETPPLELSGGEAREPDALLLDEPLSSLDSRTAASAARELVSTMARAAIPTVLVTHDFAEAALLADEVAVIDRGRIVQQGTPGELSARPGSAFVADFAGAAVIFGNARGGPSGTTVVDLDGGGSISSTDSAAGPVGVAVYPWEITLEPEGTPAHGSARNRLDARVASLTEVGNRARVGLLASQPLVAEVTGESVRRLRLAPGVGVVATWKATATRLVER
jgi:molybdate transport system ATP-binding protein